MHRFFFSMVSKNKFKNKRHKKRPRYNVSIPAQSPVTRASGVAGETKLGSLPLDTNYKEAQMDESSSSLKRKEPEDNSEGGQDVPEQKSASKRIKLPQKCVHEVAIPSGYTSSNDESIHGTLSDPFYTGEMAKIYEFKLDPFQEVSVSCLERKESILVSAHTSAGKTVVSEYAIAMAFRDKQRVIYISPLKALSNQKYRELSQEFSDVGLMTGDVTLSPKASCLVMTTEILRGMLYRGSEVLKGVAWVIFDEIHYMKDRERGVVWEESIIFLPPAIKMVFLSATMSNATQFAEWICNTHKQPCHVVYTDFRPTPLLHHVFPMGGSTPYLVVENEEFKEDNFLKLQDTFKKKNLADGKKNANAKASGRIAKGGNASAGSDINEIVKMIMDRKFQPVIMFSFSRTECEQHAKSMSELDFNTQEEKNVVGRVFTNSIECLNEEDRNLPEIESMLQMLERGIAVHHSGLLPIMKELVELLFQEGLVKALFATETFAMGLHMPAKTVVFTSVKKWDGDSHRYIGYGEYIQMSGRAGRRGKDEEGLCFIMVDDKMEMNTLKDMVLGKPAPLLSTFRLSYYSILNLMSRAEGQFTAKHVIRNSFHQFQHEKLQKFPDELYNRSRVLERLGHIDDDGVLQLKGRAAYLIDTGDGLLVTELMFEGTFNDLDHHQVASLASCFIAGDESSEQIHLRAELAKPLQQLKKSAKKIAKIQQECKLEINVDEYVKASVRSFLMDVIYCWSKGATFAEVNKMTDISEGSIILAARRLDEFLNQLKDAACKVGKVGLGEKFAAASENLRRGIMFADSLYLSW